MRSESSFFCCSRSASDLSVWLFRKVLLDVNLGTLREAYVQGSKQMPCQHQAGLVVHLCAMEGLSKNLE